MQGSDWMLEMKYIQNDLKFQLQPPVMYKLRVR